MIQRTKRSLSAELKIKNFNLNDSFIIDNQLCRIISIDRSENDANYNSAIILSTPDDSDDMIERFTKFYEKKAEGRKSLPFRVKVERDKNRKIIVELVYEN